jgi:hypothetical protein
MRRVLLLLMHLFAFAVIAYFVRTKEPSQVVEVVRTDTVMVTDTLLVVQPICTETRVTDTVRVVLRDTLLRLVEVRVPIEQRVYEDSTFRAYVSGFRPTLDSIEIIRPRTEIRIRERVEQKPPRWSLGIQGGYGVTPKGVQPYVGIGVAYRLY